MIKVYTNDNCQPCRMTKNLLTRLSIPYEEISARKTQGVISYLYDLGFSHFPVVMTETDSWSGYRPDKIKALAAQTQAC